jgi:hypothetical protein
MNILVFFVFCGMAFEFLLLFIIIYHVVKFWTPYLNLKSKVHLDAIRSDQIDILYFWSRADLLRDQLSSIEPHNEQVKILKQDCLSCLANLIKYMRLALNAFCAIVTLVVILLLLEAM